MSNGGGRSGVLNDKTPALREGGQERTSVHNDGSETFSAQYGQKGRMDYGLDRSSYAGSADLERGQKIAGSTTDLSHSLGGVQAQHREDKRGRKSGLSEP